MQRFSKLGKILTQIQWIDIFILLIATVLINEFYDLLAHSFFTPIGFNDRVMQLAQQNNAFSLWKDTLSFAATYSIFFAPFCAATLLVTALSLFLLFYREWFSGIAALIFAAYFISHIGVAGTWLFEYLIPFILALTVFLARLPDHWLIDSKNPCIGYRVFHHPIWLNTVNVFVFGVFIWYVNILSANANGESNWVGMMSALTFMVFIFISLWIDNKRQTAAQRLNHFTPHFKKQHTWLSHFITFPWLDCLTVIIGALLVYQIYEDALLHWFTVTGYENLTKIYADYTHTPRWFITFLKFSQSNANILMPLQLVIESTCALGLVILVFRAPFLTLATLLFLLLTYTEFGVPATWPANVSAPKTWTWELLLTAITSLMLTLYQWGEFFQAKTMADRFLGAPLFHHSKLSTRFAAAILGGAAMTLIVLFSHAMGKYNHIIAIEAGLTLAIYLLICAAIDYGRKQDR